MPSPIKKLVEYHIKRLTDKNVDVRLKAIKELDLLADVDALDALRDVYDNDTDVEVRKAAQAAGRSIYLKQHTAAQE